MFSCIFDTNAGRLASVAKDIRRLMAAIRISPHKTTDVLNLFVCISLLASPRMEHRALKHGALIVRGGTGLTEGKKLKKKQGYILSPY